MVLLLLLACRAPTTSEETPTTPSTPGSGGGPIVVYVTPDTLGAAQAADLGWCEGLQALFADYGLDAACVDGGVPPSSWTRESHTRMLWPTYREGALRQELVPACGSPSMLTSLAGALDARFVWAADNSALADTGVPCGGSSGWSVGADAVHTVAAPGNSYTLAQDPEAARAVALGVADLVDPSHRGPKVAFLNVFEAGGHMPRCWADPGTPACEALWEVLIEGGVASEGMDPADGWRDADLAGAALSHFGGLVDREDELRGWTLAAIEESIADHQGRRLDAPLRALLGGLQAQDRLGDLTLVMVADHGENPCAARWPEEQLHCEHGGLLTEWTGMVPTLIAPASLAADWQEAGYLGIGGEPWSTANLAYALADTFDLAAADAWPEMEPVGTATSWTCKGKSGAYGNTGVVVVGEASLRCAGGVCGAFSWLPPTSALDRPTPIAPVPDALSGIDPLWAVEACGG